MLWRLRVDAVFKDKHSNEEVTRAAVQTAGNYQVQAIVSARKRNPKKRTQGLCLDICQQIMNTVVRNPTPSTVTAWILDTAYQTNSQGEWNGGWVLYNHNRDNTWEAAQAGSIHSTSAENQSSMAATVIQHGIQCLTMTTDLQQVFLRINTLDKNVRKQLEQQEIHRESLQKVMNPLFGVLCERPTKARLQAAKFLATTGVTKTHDLLNTPSSVLKDYIQTTVPRHSKSVAGTHRQTQDIISRLTTYQASIENKT